MIAEWFHIDGRRITGLKPIKLSQKSLGQAVRECELRFNMERKTMMLEVAVLEGGNRRLVVSAVHD